MKVKRMYAMSDEAMLQNAGIMLDQAVKDHALFQTKFSWMDDAYLSVVKTDIKAARKFSGNYTIRIEIKTRYNRKLLMSEAKSCLKSLFTYAKIAYFDTKKKQSAFGNHLMNAARNSPSKMVHLLEFAYFKANKNPYKDNLMQKGYTQQNIDTLWELAQKLKGKTAGTAKSESRVTTADRIAALNTAFDHMHTFNKCAHVIFKNNPAKLTLYRLYHKKRKTGKR